MKKQLFCLRSIFTSVSLSFPHTHQHTPTFAHRATIRGSSSADPKAMLYVKTGCRVHVALILQLILIPHQWTTPESAMTLPLKSKNETQHEGEGRNISFLLPISMESKLLQLFWQAEYFSLSFFFCVFTWEKCWRLVFLTRRLLYSCTKEQDYFHIALQTLSVIKILITTHFIFQIIFNCKY